MEANPDERRLPWLEDFARDVTHGVRALRRTPAFTAVAMLTLALGIGANTAIFSIVNGVIYARLDPVARRMRYVNAGHTPPYVVRRTDAGVDVTELSVGGTVLGLFPDVEYEDAEFDIQTGDVFVTFTDGVTEARNPDGEEFGEERLKDLLRQCVGSPAGAVSTMLADRMREWIGGAEQRDDLTVAVVSVDVLSVGV